jgi:hypothetical protein
VGIENDTLQKIEEVINYKRSKDPLQIECDRLFNEMFPIKQFNSVFNLGQANMLAYLKNDLYKYFDEQGQECIDLIIETYRKHDEFNDFLNKLIKEK